MATIRAMVAEKQRQSGHSTEEEIIKEKVRRHLVEVCELLPNETPEGQEFASLMLQIQDHRIREEAMKTLVARAMDVRDDLCDYPLLRQKLVDVINVDAVVPKSCFFALLDILGFKDLVRQTAYEELKKTVEDFVRECKNNIDFSRTIGQQFKIKLSHVHVWVVSDSIYVWMDDNEILKQFVNLLHVVNTMLVRGIENNLPLRGVVTYGELFVSKKESSDNGGNDFSFDSGSLYGKALVEAHEAEREVKWSGAVLTPNAWSRIVEAFKKGMSTGTSIRCPDDLFNTYPYLLWYDVPKEGGKEKAIAFNWNYRSGQNLDVEKIRKAFSVRDGLCKDDVKLKCDETVSFFEATKPFMESCDTKLVKSLPIPDSNYAKASTI